MYTIIIILIFLFVFLPIMTYADSERLKRKKKLEKYGSATAEYISNVSDSLSGFIYKCTESKENKEKRENKFSILSEISKAKILGLDYETSRTFDSFTNSNAIKLREALCFFNIPENKFMEILERARAIGQIEELYVNPMTNNRHDNTINWNTFLYEKFCCRDKLKEALCILGISKDEWIKYGYTTIDMHNHNEFISKFCDNL